MKRWKIIFFIIIGVNCFAQDPQLFENPWYLQKLTIENIDILPPNDSQNVTEHVFIEDGGDVYFSTGYCDFLSCEIIFNDATNSFDIINILELGDDCVTTDDFNFNAIYSNYLREYMEFNPYNYVLSLEGDIRYLEFTNANGNKALYSNQLLTVNKQQFIAVSVFPNPVLNELKIETNSTIDLVAIYSITGQLVKQLAPVSNNSTINLEKLVSGVYFIKLTTEEGAVLTRKIIKE